MGVETARIWSGALVNVCKTNKRTPIVKKANSTNLSETPAHNAHKLQPNKRSLGLFIRLQVQLQQLIVTSSLIRTPNTLINT